MYVVGTHPMKVALAVVSLAFLGASCTGAAGPSSSPSTSVGTSSPSTPTVQPVTDYGSFIEALGAAGLKVRQGERTRADPLFWAGQKVFIDGVQVSTYEYPSAPALDEFMSGVSRDGSSIPTREGGGMAIVQWSPPHFFGAGKLLVLYFGDKKPTLGALSGVLGPAFAGE